MLLILLAAPSPTKLRTRTRTEFWIRVFLQGFGFGLGFWISVLDFRSLGLLLDANALGNVSHENIGLYEMESFFQFFSNGMQKK